MSEMSSGGRNRKEGKDSCECNSDLVEEAIRLRADLEDWKTEEKSEEPESEEKEGRRAKEGQRRVCRESEDRKAWTPYSK